jgi:hypothetical protein
MLRSGGGWKRHFSEFLEIRFSDRPAFILNNVQSKNVREILENELEEVLSMDAVVSVNHENPYLIVTVRKTRGQTKVLLAKIPIVPTFCRNGKEGYLKLIKDLQGELDK